MSKYKSVKMVIDGIKFDSKAEGEFYLYLRRKEEVSNEWIKTMIND